MKTIALIDGFNFYHPIHQHFVETKECLKCLNYFTLAESLIKEADTLSEVIFFTAVAKHLGVEKTKRHRLYIRALKAKKIRVVEGNFKRKKKKVYLNEPDKHKIDIVQWGHEEKETDVRIALEMLDYAYQDLFDKCLLFTADSDLVPAINKVKSRFPKKEIVLVVPPGTRNIAGLQKAVDNNVIFIRPKKLRENQLPKSIKLKNWKRPIHSPYT